MKAKRALRPAEQAIVDSGPMGLAINAAASAPVEVAKEVERRRKRKLDLVEVDEEEEKELEEVKRKKLEEKEVRRKAFEATQAKEGIVKAVVGELKKKKKSSKRKAEEIEGGEEGREVKEKVVVAELSKKEKKEMYKQKAKEAAAILAGELKESTPPPKEPSPPLEPLTRKRGRKSAHIQTLTTPLLPSTKSTSDPSSSILNPLVSRKKKVAGGVLSALKGTEAEQAEEKAKEEAKAAKRNEYVPTGANAVLEKPNDEVVQKEKTSVLKVVEVKRSHGGKKEKNSNANGDAASLLMGKKVEQVGLGWD